MSRKNKKNRQQKVNNNIEETKKVSEELTEEEELELTPLKKAEHKLIIAAGLLVVFVIGLLYNAYSNTGHIFGNEVANIYSLNDYLVLGSRYARVEVDAVVDWYDGVEKYPDGSYAMKGDKASCIVWLDNNLVLSVTVSDKEKFDKLNSIYEATQKYLEDENEPLTESIELEGQLQGFSKAGNKLYEQTREDRHFTEASWISDYGLNLNTDMTRDMLRVSSIIYIILAVVSLIATLAFAGQYRKLKSGEDISDEPDEFDEFDER